VCFSEIICEFLLIYFKICMSKLSDKNVMNYNKPVTKHVTVLLNCSDLFFNLFSVCSDGNDDARPVKTFATYPKNRLLEQMEEKCPSRRSG